ncbi:putative phage abortive infection protein [Janthinobacterium sp. 78]|uniref:putative phage abortive infection protein n=1 Tax=Janthinobacterium sp. 78 TaxID=2135631 RepID=UPI000D5EF1E9|nr:putative phage abortive infection protein [Janthinobacterium sp. 78]PVX36759.1 putative phage abortive infection protein [Janthinobacterium sp. 78]
MEELGTFCRMKRWLKTSWLECSILLLGLVAVNAIFAAQAFRETKTINPAGAGLLGDFVGGYIGSYFALVSIVLLYRTLKSQRQAYQLQSFEAKYFELLKMHRENVAELEIQGTSGRKIFVLMIRELRSLLDVVKSVAASHGQTLTQKERVQIAYNCFFFGTGPNSSRMLRQSLAEFNSAFINSLENELDRPETKQQAQKERKLAFVPFEGHQSRLGHYYRHLYQAVRYVDQQKIDIDKYEYTKTIRAQLTTHEQALLLLNSLTPMGKSWWDRKFMIEYRMVQNLPRHFFDPASEIDLSVIFPVKYFEWEDAEGVS